MFHAWDGFYLLIGSASAGLIGLMFVVTTLMTGTDRARSLKAASLYTTPTVFHFGVVLAISALAAVPGLPDAAAVLIVAGCALAGVAYAVVVAPQLRRGIPPDTPHWSDFWCYGAAPGAVYLGLAAACALAPVWPRLTAYGVGFLLLALLLVGIRNAWDLVTWLAPRAQP